MVSLKKYYKANSILESVIALTIISICLFIAIIVYSQVFSVSTSLQHFNKQNLVNQQFYEMQLNLGNNNSERIELEERWINTNLKEISAHLVDSLDNNLTAKFYLYGNE